MGVGLCAAISPLCRERGHHSREPQHGAFLDGILVGV
jgi:hypothetical protein